jgi:hypothetical protein
MGSLLVLVPCDPLAMKQADAHFAPEAEAARSEGPRSRSWTMTYCVQGTPRVRFARCRQAAGKRCTEDGCCITRRSATGGRAGIARRCLAHVAGGIPTGPRAPRVVSVLRGPDGYVCMA